MSTRMAGAAAVVVVAGLGATAWGQWTVTPLHPTGVEGSAGLAVWERGAGGYQRVAGEYQAVVVGLGGPFALAPQMSGAAESFVYSMDVNQTVGSYATTGSVRAVLWPTLFGGALVDLHPSSGATSSVAFGVSDGTQVGSAVVSGQSRAALWRGTAESMVGLHPAGAAWSEAYGIDLDDIVGAVGVWPGGAAHAAMWSRDEPGAWVDLHPGHAAWSVANGVSRGRQAGSVWVGGERHAAIWNGTASSMLDLSPAGTDDSVIWGVSNGWQAGQARFGVHDHAVAWNLEPSTWVDLHQMLPPRYSSSVAFAVHADVQRVRVVGSAHNAQTGRDEAMLWERELPPLPEPSYLYNNLDGAATDAPGDGFNPQSVSASGVPGNAGARWRENASDGAPVDPIFNSLLGVGCNPGYPSTAVADDFTVPAGKIWTISRMRFYGYSTGAPPFGSPSIQAASVKIWRGAPWDGGTAIYNDSSALSGVEWTGLYNIGATVGCEPAAAEGGRAIMRVWLDVSPLELQPGTYWVEVSMSGTTPASGAMMPTQVYAQNVRARASDNARHLVGGVWMPIEDVGVCGGPAAVGQDVSFVVLGSEGELCESGADLTGTAVAGMAGFGVPDRRVTNDDFFYFLLLYADSLGCSGGGCPTPPDMTGSAIPGALGYGAPDGVVNSDDFFYLLALFAAGC